jgi:hypothetical protein
MFKEAATNVNVKYYWNTENIKKQQMEHLELKTKKLQNGN